MTDGARCSGCGGSDLKSLVVLYEAERANLPRPPRRSEYGLGFLMPKPKPKPKPAWELSDVAPPTKWERDKKEEGAAMARPDIIVASSMGIIIQVIGGRGSEIASALSAVVWGYALIMALKRQHDYRREIERWNEEEYPELLAEWSRSVKCMTCGRIQPIDG